MTLDTLHSFLVKEDAIDNIELKGDWNPSAKKYGYDKPSIGILTNPKGLERVKKKWEKPTTILMCIYYVPEKETGIPK